VVRLNATLFMHNNSEKFYDRLTFLYPIIDLFLRSQKRKLFRKINNFPYGRILEVGVGNGAHFKYYNTHEIIGIDTSRSMLTHARKHLKRNIQLIHMDGEKLLFPNEAFDYVVLSHVIAVVGDPDKLLEEVYRVLKPNGKVFILNHFTPNNWLKYIDKTFKYISKLVFFKSVFHMSDVRSIEKFKLRMDINAGLSSYFKILIYYKKV
jgi:phosphatidylethanolamine/phosphatidyl-N-methylethanolamine N-methyltransferase